MTRQHQHHDQQRAYARRQAIASAQALLASGPLYLDTETTGFRSNAEIIEVAVIDEAGQPLLNQLIKPVDPIPPDATAVNGLTNDDVAGAPPFTAIYDQLVALLAGRPVVIYNAEFDIRLIRQSIRRYSPDLALPVVQPTCLMQLYAAYRAEHGSRLGEWRWHKLSAALTHSGLVVPPDVHRALADTQAARLLLQHVAAQGESPA